MRLALALLLLVFVPSFGNKGKDKPKPSYSSGQTNAEAPGRSQVSPGLKEIGAPIPQDEAQKQEANTAPKPQPFMSHAEWIMSGLTAIYVFLTAIYVLYSRKTLKELQRQIGLIEKQDVATQRQLDISQMSAEAAMQGVALQKAQLKQWVDIDEWEGHSEHFFPNATRTTYWLSFWITNPTRMPLTFRSADIATPDKKPVLRISGADYVIAPENGYHVEWPTVVVDDTMKALVKGEWNFGLVIDIDFVDAFGEARHSQFTVGCKCWTTNCEIKEYGNRQPT